MIMLKINIENFFCLKKLNLNILNEINSILIYNLAKGIILEIFDIKIFLFILIINILLQLSKL